MRNLSAGFIGLRKTYVPSLRVTQSSWRLGYTSVLEELSLLPFLTILEGFLIFLYIVQKKLGIKPISIGS